MTADNVSTGAFDMAEWRRRLGRITQAEAGALLGIHPQTISDMERGDPARKLLRLACAAALLGVVDYDGHHIEFGRIKRTSKMQSRLRNEKESRK